MSLNELYLLLHVVYLYRGDSTCCLSYLSTLLVPPTLLTSAGLPKGLGFSCLSLLMEPFLLLVVRLDLVEDDCG